MVIAIDIDNVIVNTTQCVLNYINERIPNLNLQIKDITSYWIEDALPPEYKWIVPMAFEDKNMWKQIQLIDGAVENIEKLYMDGHEIYFATATTAENFRKKVKYLTRVMPFFPEGYVHQHAISIKKKQLLWVDVLIDDYTKNLIGIKRYVSICLDYPWNQDFYGKSNIADFVAYNWDEVYKYCTDISHGIFI